MSKIAFEDGGAQEETVSAFLMLVLEYGMTLQRSSRFLRRGPIQRAKVLLPRSPARLRSIGLNPVCGSIALLPASLLLQ